MNDLIEKIQDRTAIISVIGLGYVGLPLVKQFMEAEFQVIGVDCDGSKVDSLNSGKSYIESVDSLLVDEWVKSEKFEAQSKASLRSDIHIICVPTPLTESREPDLSYVKHAVHEVGSRGKEGSMVILESTTYPTTTRTVVKQIVDEWRIEKTLIAYSPEREDPGYSNHSIGKIPKVVGGIDQESLDVATALYETIVPEVVRVSSCEVAEACKILENTYRAVNIALVNEMKILYDKIGIDIWEVIEAAETKPFGFQAFYPGPGIGGHCLPCDPFYLSWLAKTNGMDTRFIELAGEVNRSMPEYVVNRTMVFMNEFGKAMKGSSILVLGLCYKKNVADPRESPSFKVIELLLELGVHVEYHDPLIPDMPKMRGYDFSDYQDLSHSVSIPEWAISHYDAAILLTDHSCFDYKTIFKKLPLIVDTRGVTNGASFSNVRKC